MASEKKIFEYFVEHLAFRLPWQPIKISDLDKIHMVSRGLLQENFCQNICSKTYSPVQKVITLRDLQEVFSYVEHLSIEQWFMPKSNTSIQNIDNKRGNCCQCC